MQTALIDPANLANPVLEICRILLEHEISRNEKAAEVSQTLQGRDASAASNRIAKTTRPAHFSRRCLNEQAEQYPTKGGNVT